MMKLVLCLLLYALTLSACADSAKYSREQCIVRVNIEWAKISSNDKESMVRLITDSIRQAPDMGFNKIPASSTIQGKNREFIYYQHEDDCQNRILNMERLLSYVQESVNNVALPNMSVDPGSFKPGVDTIRLSGPNWKDREKPVGKRITVNGKDYIKVD